MWHTICQAEAEIMSKLSIVHWQFDCRKVKKTQQGNSNLKYSHFLESTFASLEIF